MLGARRREVAALAARERLAGARAVAASARVRRAKTRFLADPLNLLLPFGAGALGGALVFRRKPRATRRGPGREGIAWAPMLKTATTLWGLSLPLREALLDARAADIRAADPHDEATGRTENHPVRGRATTPAAETPSAPVPPSPVPREPVRQPAPPA